MINNLQEKTALRRGWLLGLVGPVIVATAALAQETNVPAKLKPVVVTGSLIPTAETAQPTPVDVISVEQVEKVGAQNLYQLVRTLPGSYGPGNFGDSRGNGGNGTAGIGIRGLTKGTLVLINGRRVAPENHGIGSGNVDLNLVPLAAIDR